MKYAFVTPRYGLEVLGGAELGARMIAERLVERLGWSVEIFTSCALDSITWADHYPAGDEVLNGVAVHRFPTVAGRPPEFFPFSERVLSAPRAATLAEAWQFIDLQGPGCPDLLEALGASDVRLFAFYPYLYTPTVRGLPLVAERAIMHPAAHDEPAIHLPVFRETMRAAKGFVFQTSSERAFVQRLFGVAHVPEILLGLGVDESFAESFVSRSEPVSRADPVSLGDRPYLLCLGRVDGLKGTTMLAELFAVYKERNPGPLALVMAGPVSATPPAHPDLILAGPVSEEDKWELLAGALALVSPSPHEAFSIVLMEAWTAGLPVVVNGRCAATREHCERSGGGLWFSSYPELEVVLDRIAANASLRAALAEAGRRYVQANYTWPVIIDRYASFVERLAGA
ncbi:MAG: glycosyltransferase family 4 protein [Actinobacteria bacterium]|nr:glycosyltransferase family 4 protein [Actinomycetota bacterium]